MTPERDDAPPASGADVKTRTAATHSTSFRYSQGQRSAASWAVGHANLWREHDDADKRIAALEARVAQLERLASGEQVP